MDSTETRRAGDLPAVVMVGRVVTSFIPVAISAGMGVQLSLRLNYLTAQPIIQR
jgi:hypothetical protein